MVRLERKTIALCTRGELVLLLLAACASRPAGPPPLPVAEPADVVRVVRERERQVVSLRAVFTADTDLAGQRRAADGILLVRKPDRFRLRLVLPFGLTILDYVSRGDAEEIVTPLRKGGSLPRDLAPFSRQDLGAAFLRGRDAFPGSCRAARDGGSDYMVTCVDSRSGALLRRLRIDGTHGTVLEEVTYGRAGEPRMILEFGSYRRAGTTFLPYRVRMIYPATSLAVEISVRRYEVNPELPDELFQPVTP